MPLKRALARTMASAFDDEYLRVRRKKKIPVVPVSYREKIRVGNKFFFEYFFHGFGVFLLGDLQ
jgi:hypothetical protein